MESSRAQVRIEGPTVRNTFFVRDTDNRVWDGKNWRGFGMAMDYSTFHDAFRAARVAKAALNRAAYFKSSR